MKPSSLNGLILALLVGNFLLTSSLLIKNHHVGTDLSELKTNVSGLEGEFSDLAHVVGSFRDSSTPFQQYRFDSSGDKARTVANILNKLESDMKAMDFELDNIGMRISRLSCN